MTRHDALDTIAFNRINRGDIGRWTVALVVVAGVASASVWMLQNWSPPVAVMPAAEPAIMLDLEPAPPVEPVPPEPEIAEPVPPPAVEPPAEPEAVEPPTVAEPEPPAVEPPPVEPEPMVEPEPLPEPVPDEPAEIAPDLPAPVTMSAQLRQQREQTPAISRRREPPVQEQAEPAPEQVEPRQAAPTQPSAPAADRVSVNQWQAQVIRQLDRNKIYPADARQRREQGAVEINFLVDGNGRVSGVGLARSSGFPALDQAAIDTARAASPLPAPPEGLAGLPLSMVVRFTLR